MAERDPNGVAPLPAGHPLHGQGLLRCEICDSCKGYGKHFCLGGTTAPCGRCKASGLTKNDMFWADIARQTNLGCEPMTPARRMARAA